MPKVRKSPSKSQAMSEPINFSVIAVTIGVILVITAAGIVLVNKFKDKR